MRGTNDSFVEQGSELMVGMQGTFTRARMTVIAVVCVLSAASQARADVNHTPIALPLIGTSGAASPYPSTIQVAARGGPSQSSSIRIILHAVTHPCPEDLAVLLVRNNTQKYLLMSHAGSCKPLQGTNIIFATGSPTLPDSTPDTTPHGPTLQIAPSNYGSQPAFPAPAPAGPYTTALPTTLINATWDLYVIDTSAGDRGVIAAGWSFHYDTSPTFTAPGLPSPLPNGAPATTIGPATDYPITFDLSNVPAGVKVRDLDVRMMLSHGYSDDIRLLLEAPNGEKVQFMANAGGSNVITGVVVLFDDSAAASLPDSGQIVAGTFKPSSYGSQANFPGPAPPMPYATSFATLNGQDLRGVWKLWAYDDASGQSGAVNSAQLIITTEEAAPAVSFQVPTAGVQYTATTPFLHIEALVAFLSSSPHSTTWRVMNGGQYYASGPMTVVGTNTIAADVPLKKGASNFIQIYVRNTDGTIEDNDGLDVTVDEFVYTLSEGATGGFFDLDVTLGNPTGSAAPVTINFLPENSGPVNHSTSVSANGQVQLRVDDLTPGDAISTVVHSTNAVPLAVERTMSWDANGYGGSGGTALTPNPRWLFAEGSQGFFDTFILLANDNATPADVSVKYLIEGGSPVTVPYTLQPHSRRTIFAGDQPEVVNTSFGLDITSNLPIAAERSMYFPHSGGRTFEGGHEAAGTNGTSTRWYLAEGATGPFFECFVLLSNPNGSLAHATLTYLLPDGTTIPQNVDVPANGRVTIDVETVNPALANTPVSTVITSDLGIIVERSMYWPDISVGWAEAHNSVGVVDPALRWAVADGRIGGPRDHQTYILLANPNAVPAEVIVRFLQTGFAPVIRSYTLPPTSRTNIAPGTDIPELGVGVFSADVQVQNYQPIIVEKALYWNSGGQVWAAGTGTIGTPIPPPE
jgi:subtilisin-like proprotein convertase family protein